MRSLGSGGELFMRMHIFNAAASNAKALRDIDLNNRPHSSNQRWDIATDIRMSMHGDWRDTLVSKHRRLFEDEKGNCSGYPTTGDGWRQLIERAVNRIAGAVGEGSLTISQIKAKYGTLRLYHSPAADLDDMAQGSVEEAIALAEARSACTCEVCGGEGRLFERGDWLATACDRHSVGQPAQVPAGWENVHIVRKFEAGRPRIIACRRYMRATDTFEDVPPFSLDLEE
jgi:hypothetical protein